MRLLVNCPSGESRLLQVHDTATVHELKQLLYEEEGIPVQQQVLCFAGHHLKDHLTLKDHNLDQYTLSDEVVLYLSKHLADAKQIFLTSRAKLTQKLTELVESNMPVGDVMGLLESRGLAVAFVNNAPIYAKRQDSTTVPMQIEVTESIASLQARLAAAEGVMPSMLTFLQAQDGAMHMVLYPSADSSFNTYPIYQRPNKPQTVLMRKRQEEGQPLPELVKELCVLP